MNWRECIKCKLQKEYFRIGTSSIVQVIFSKEGISAATKNSTLNLVRILITELVQFLYLRRYKFDFDFEKK